VICPAPAVPAVPTFWTPGPRWCPSWWDESRFGQWKDLRLVRSQIPPSYKSATTRTNYHWVIIAFGREPSHRMGFRHPYDCIYCWRCFRCPALNGSMSMDRHLATLLKALSFPSQYKSTAKPVNLLNTVAVTRRQATDILPPTNSSNFPTGIQRRSRNTRTMLSGRPNPIYDLNFSSAGTGSSSPQQTTAPDNDSAGVNTADDASTGQSDQAFSQSASAAPVTSTPNQSPPEADTNHPSDQGLSSNAGIQDPQEGSSSEQAESSAHDGTGSAAHVRAAPDEAVPDRAAHTATSPPPRHGAASDQAAHAGASSPPRAASDQAAHARPSTPPVAGQAGASSSNPNRTSSSARQTGRSRSRTGPEALLNRYIANIDQYGVYAIPEPSQLQPISTTFDRSHLQSVGLNNDGNVCGMISLIMGFHRLQILPHLLDPTFCFIANRSPDYPSLIFHKVLSALPSQAPFSIQLLIESWNRSGRQPDIQPGMADIATIAEALVTNMQIKRYSTHPVISSFLASFRCSSCGTEHKRVKNWEGQVQAAIPLLQLPPGNLPANIPSLLADYLDASFETRCSNQGCRQKF
jgi:hypothetical protein